MYFIDKPQPAKVETYHQAIDFLVERIKKESGVIAIYHFGNITTPGISDIDLLVIFEDDISCKLDVFENYPPEFRRLFTHTVDAMAISFCKPTSRFTSWNNIQCLFGNPNLLGHFDGVTDIELQQLKIQIALEYLLTNYMDLTVQLTYNIIKLRALLQHLKGLHYDFEYLGVTSGKVYEMILQLREWIKNWFEHPPSEKELSAWIKNFYKEYDRFIKDMFLQYPFYVPKKEKYVYVKNMVLYPGKKIEVIHKGIVFPAFFSKLWQKKYYNLHHRFNHFEFSFPVQHHHNYKIIAERTTYFNELGFYNQNHFPNFSTLTTGFTV